MLKLFGTKPDTLANLLAAPAVWAIHFLVVYVAAAYRCAPNADVFEPIAGLRVFIAAVTIVALAFIVASFLHAWRDWKGKRHPPHDRSTIDDRERFLEFSTILLASLSFLGVILDALPALFFADCR